MQKGLTAVVIVAALAVGGWLMFGKNDKASAPTTNNPANTTTPSPTPSSTDSQDQTAASTSSVAIQNFAFSPASITVKKGTTVTWTNKDSAPHDVKENDGKKGPGSNTLSNGQSYSFTFTEVGTFNYICTIHPNMTGTVTVTE